jgi:hypothetical protein
MQWASEPEVMMGIHLGEPDAALCSHLRLEEGIATMVSGLRVGLPADEAGLGLYDVIIKIDDQTPADPASLQKALAEKEPGDVVTLTVIHEGRKQKVTVELEAYDGKAMQEAELIGVASDSGLGTFFAPTWSTGAYDHAFKLYRQFDGSKLHDVFIDPTDPTDRVFLRPRVEVRPRVKVDVPEAFAEPEAVAEGADGKLDRLNERLAELEARLAKLLEQLSEIRD